MLAVSVATGAVAAEAEYDSFGARAITVGTAAEMPRYGFTGREHDGESGLIYYRARHYDPAIGQFVQRDPIGFAAGDLNLYAYVGNDPYNWTDPSGLTASSEYAGITAGSTGWMGVFYTAVTRLAQTMTAILVLNSDASPDDENQPDTDKKPPEGPHEGDAPETDSNGNPIPEVPELPDDWDGTTPPGPEWEWKGAPGSQPGGKDGNWYNPETGTSVGPDFNHGPPIGSHVDVSVRGGWGQGYRHYPGTPGMYPKPAR